MVGFDNRMLLNGARHGSEGEHGGQHRGNEEEKVDWLRFHRRTPESLDTRAANEATDLQMRRPPFRSLSRYVHEAVFTLCSA
jgi:hypothetical protein